MYWIDQKYIRTISSRLDRFKQTNSTNYNFRCFYCGDSKKNKLKARAWLLLSKGSYMYHCYNCGKTTSFYNFLKQFDNAIFSEYLKDRLVETGSLKNRTTSEPQPKTELEEFVDRMKKPKFIKFSELKSLKKISQLKPEHPASIYVHNRLIPNKWHSMLFYCNDFYPWVNSIIPDKFNLEKMPKEPRLIIPFIDEDDNLFGFQGRAFKASNVKYITILIDENHPPIFGINRVDFNKQFFVFEGPIDAMFINNSIATSGGNLVAHLSKMNINKENAVIIYDNEPRSIHTVEKMEKAIDNGFKICIWPQNIKQKDVNDMVIYNKQHTNVDLYRRQLEAIICNNIFQGLSAKLALNQWKRV